MWNLSDSGFAPAPSELCSTPCGPAGPFVSVSIREHLNSLLDPVQWNSTTTYVAACPQLRLTRGYRWTCTPLSTRLEVSNGLDSLVLNVSVGTTRSDGTFSMLVEGSLLSLRFGGQLRATPVVFTRMTMNTVRRLTDDPDVRRLAARLITLGRAFGPARDRRVATAWVHRHRRALSDVLPGIAIVFAKTVVVDTVLGPLKAVPTIDGFDQENTPWLSTRTTLVDARGHLVPMTTDRALLAAQQARAQLTGEHLVVDDDVAVLGGRTWRIVATLNRRALLALVKPPDRAVWFEEVVAVHVPGHGWAFVPPNTPNYRRVLDELRNQARAIAELTRANGGICE